MKSWFKGKMKKVFVVFLVFAYINCYFGCTTTKTLVRTVDDLHSDDDVPLRFITRDSTYYVLEKGTYNVEEDTLIGKGWANKKGAYLRTGENKWYKIPLNDIKQIKEEDTTVIDAGFTAPIIGAAIAFVGGLFVLFFIFASEN